MLLLAAIAGANDHKGLAGPTSRNMQSCEKFEIFFWKFFRQGEKYFWEPRFLTKNFQIWKIEAAFYRRCLESSWQIATKPYFSSRACCKLKTLVAVSRNIAWFSKRDMQLLHYFKTWKLHGPVVIKEGFICKHCRLQHKKNLINRSFSFYLSV